jgi:hypothetical protein
MPRKRHKPEEIVTKLRQVDVLVFAIAHHMSRLVVSSETPCRNRPHR